MAKNGVRDSYANKFYGSVTESGANTLTFSEIATNVNVFDKVAWVLTRLEWWIPPASVLLLVAAADNIQAALTASQNITDLDLDNAAVIDVMRLGIVAPSDTTSCTPITMPLIRDFSAMPGGGLIIAPRPLYVGVMGASLASASTAECRGYFRQIDLKAEEYLDLVDFYRIVA